MRTKRRLHNQIKKEASFFGLQEKKGYDHRRHRKKVKIRDGTSARRTRLTEIKEQEQLSDLRQLYSLNINRL